MSVQRTVPKLLVNSIVLLNYPSKKLTNMFIYEEVLNQHIYVCIVNQCTFLNTLYSTHKIASFKLINTKSG